MDSRSSESAAVEHFISPPASSKGDHAKMKVMHNGIKNLNGLCRCQVEAFEVNASSDS